jgi:hypothetical protein
MGEEFVKYVTAYTGLQDPAGSERTHIVALTLNRAHAVATATKKA